MSGTAPTTLTAPTVPFPMPEVAAGLERLRRALWAVLSLDTGTAEQRAVHSPAASAPAAPVGAPTGGKHRRESEDQVDGEEVAGLVARAQAGEADAFGEIYDRYSETVYRYIYFRVNNAQLAEDLASETFCGRCGASRASAGRAGPSGPGW
ncbi:hypothetical protein GCM10029992_18880 [Glycomyces albus]